MEQIDMVKIFKALSNEQRLKIFKMLYDWNEVSLSEENDLSCCDEGVERCFTKACCTIELSRSTVSHHFKELQNAGLIQVTRNGQSFICKVNLEAIEAIRNYFK